jgi:plasmid stabilization system protein ParE
MPASNGCSRPDAYPLDSGSSDQPRAHQGLPDRALSHLARSTVLQLYETIRTLKAFPHRGRLGCEEGTRELVLPRLPFVVVYRVNQSMIEVLHIYHGAQNRH